MKKAIVTGANGAIGQAIAQGIAQTGEYELTLLCRNQKKAELCKEQIIQATGNQDVDFIIVDLCRQKSIKSAAEQWQGPLHLLINNAAISPRQRQESPEGIEMQFAVNVLGYFWMIQAFHNFLTQAIPARVVNVASYWAGGLDLNDLEFKERPYNNDQSYRQSKQADRMLSAAWAAKLKQANITVNSCHPGDVNSTLSNDLGFGGHESPEQGALTPLWVALSPELSGKTGLYFEHMQELNCRFCESQIDVKNLFEACLKY